MSTRPSYGPYLGTLNIRKHFSWYLKPLPGGAEIYAEVKTMGEPDRVKDRIQDYFYEHEGQQKNSLITIT
jgi:tRNA-dihydrouridine synthase